MERKMAGALVQEQLVAVAAGSRAWKQVVHLVAAVLETLGAKRGIARPIGLELRRREVRVIAVARLVARHRLPPAVGVARAEVSEVDARPVLVERGHVKRKAVPRRER